MRLPDLRGVVLQLDFCITRVRILVDKAPSALTLPFRAGAVIKVHFFLVDEKRGFAILGVYGGGGIT